MLKEEFLFAEKYKLKKLLGRGGFSEVWLAEDTLTNVEVAVKVYAAQARLEEEGIEIFRKEFALVFGLNHTNLLHPTYFDVWQDMPYLILPYCKEGSVFKFISKGKRITEEQCWNLLHDVAAGLSYMHERTPPLIHQDIKPDNILISDEGRYMITDFGISTKVRNTIATMQNAASTMSSGTLAYMGPERFSTKPKPLMASDVWSLGAMMYELMTGGNPPFGNHGGALQKGGADIPEIEEKEFSDQLKEMVYWCMSANTWDRPTARSIEEITYKKLHGIDIAADLAKHKEELMKNQPKDQGDSRPTTIANWRNSGQPADYGQQPRPSGDYGQQPRPSGSYSQQPRPSGYYEPQPRPSGNYGQQPRPSGYYEPKPRPSGNYVGFDQNLHGTQMDHSHMGSGDVVAGKKNKGLVYGGIAAAAVVVIALVLWLTIGGSSQDSSQDVVEENVAELTTDKSLELLGLMGDAERLMSTGEKSLALKKKNDQLLDDSDGAVENEFIGALDKYDELKSTAGYDLLDAEKKAEAEQGQAKAKEALAEILEALKKKAEDLKSLLGDKDETYLQIVGRAERVEQRLKK